MSSVKPVATPVTQLDRTTVRERVLEVIRVLLEELGSQGALPMLALSSQLDRDLGLGSLERVELLARLETTFGVRLPDRVSSEANTPDDLVGAILEAPGSAGEELEPELAVRASVTAQKLHREAEDAGVYTAETLIETYKDVIALDYAETFLNRAIRQALSALSQILKRTAIEQQ